MSSTAAATSDAPLVLTDVADHVGTITLNRPDKYNALSRDMLSALQGALDGMAKREDVRVIVLAAEGKAFCAGHDLKEMRGTEARAEHQALFDQCGAMMQTIGQIPQPVIARVQGIATAAGCQLVAACDLAVAAEGAKFAVSGINVGLFCSTPAVPLSRNLSRKRAMQMLLTGDFIDAATAADWGLINDVVPADALNETTLALAARIAAKTPLSIQLGKRMFYQQLQMPLGEAYDFASERMATNMDSEDAREGIDAFIGKRSPVWRGR